VPFEKRGKIMDENLEIITKFWTEDMLKGEYMYHKIPAGVMYPKPVQKPRPPILIGGYVDRVLKRAAIDGDGWLTYFYRPESFAKSWTKIRNFAKEGGKDPNKLLNAAHLPIRIGKSRAEVEAGMMDWLGKEWDYASWSESTKDSAVLGTVDECVEQLKAHLAVGAEADLRSVSLRNGPDRDHRARNNPAAEEQLRIRRNVEDTAQARRRPDDQRIWVLQEQRWPCVAWLAPRPWRQPGADMQSKYKEMARGGAGGQSP
jgi:alkanesulfonate monooxygenase SsuD/methylene tetrahydromethanopterin reductase-like flavin-dependent oxidoreductase (luciferase family)